MSNRTKDKIDGTIIPAFGALAVAGVVSLASPLAGVALFAVGFAAIGLYLALDN